MKEKIAHKRHEELRNRTEFLGLRHGNDRDKTSGIIRKLIIVMLIVLTIIKLYFIIIKHYIPG